MSGVTITCVYCGMQYPAGTPASGAPVLTEHIKVCEKHPLRKAEADIAKLRNALAGLIGASDRAELEGMEAMMRTQTSIAPRSDIVAAINAIHALLETEEIKIPVIAT
jgi:hypothetical protein